MRKDHIGTEEHFLQKVLATKNIPENIQKVFLTHICKENHQAGELFYVNIFIYLFYIYINMHIHHLTDHLTEPAPSESLLACVCHYYPNAAFDFWAWRRRRW